MRAGAGALALTTILSACGGGSSPQSPTPSPAPPITRGPVASLRGLVFYDEDGYSVMAAELFRAITAPRGR